MARQKRSPPSPTGGRPSRRSSRSIAQAAVSHEGKAAAGGEVRLTLRITLSRAQAERLTARAISEGKNLNALVAEILSTAS
jgi:hypothetical protein